MHRVLYKRFPMDLADIDLKDLTVFLVHKLQQTTNIVVGETPLIRSKEFQGLVQFVQFFLCIHHSGGKLMRIIIFF